MTNSLNGVVPSIIDAHIHQWDPFTTPREASALAPLYKRAPRVVERLMPVLANQGNRELVLTPRQVGRAYLPSDYAADTRLSVAAVGVPVEAAIHVEAGWHGPDPAEETTWVAGLPFGATGTPALAAIVAHADPRDPGASRVLDAHMEASPLVRGIRLVTAWHPDKGVKRFIDTDGVLSSPEFLRGFAAIAERGLTFDVYVYSDQLRQVSKLAQEYPETTIILDHFATPVGYLGPMGKNTGRAERERIDLMVRWRDDLADVASHPNVVAKQSGHAFPMLGLRDTTITREQLAERTAPLINHTAEVFGEDRLVFGSNYPMDKAVTDYGTLVGALVDVLAPRGNALLAKTFRDNAKRVYQL